MSLSSRGLFGLHPATVTRLHEIARLLPLFTAILAPTSTLLDIPAVTEPWYALYSVPQHDIQAALVLSIVGLFFNVVANALLIVRFSTGEGWWRIATRVSTICWNAKATLGIVNLIVFGAFSRNGPGYSYLEGFWCAVISVIISGIISICLTFHWLGNFDADPMDTSTKDIRLQGRQFMNSVITLLVTVAIQALIFSKIEHWTYFDGIYFSVGTMLVVGFGDFTPTQTSTRILLFPFAVLTIAQLASQIGMIIGYISAQSQARKDRWRLEYEAARRSAYDVEFPEADLEREIQFLEEIHRKQDEMSDRYTLAWSLLGFLVFWIVGSVLFHVIERWAYGTSFYFCYVFFLTIGYGDYVPKKPAGRVVFVIYSLMSVPIITAFVVHTFTQIITRLSERQLIKQRRLKGIDPPMPSYRDFFGSETNSFTSHTHFIEQHHDEWAKRMATMKEKSRHDEEAEGQQAFDSHLMNRVIRLAIELEERSRHLLIENLSVGSKAGILLKADLKVQLRDLKTLEEEGGIKEDDDTGSTGSAGYIGRTLELEGLNTLEQVNLYRQTFAGLLHAASVLKDLKGVEKHRFERRRLRALRTVKDESISRDGPGHV